MYTLRTHTIYYPLQDEEPQNSNNHNINTQLAVVTSTSTSPKKTLPQHPTKLHRRSVGGSGSGSGSVYNNNTSSTSGGNANNNNRSVTASPALGSGAHTGGEYSKCSVCRSVYNV